MTLSANTNVIAAPQRGGDRAPQQPVGTMPAGRQQDARGTIDRRAEGATYSPTPPTSGAAALHPTTGVRRARELSPSLRSQNHPHAQLVEGYKPSTGVQLGYESSLPCTKHVTGNASRCELIQFVARLFELNICLSFKTPNPVSNVFKHSDELDVPASFFFELEDLYELKNFLSKPKNNGHATTCTRFVYQSTQQVIQREKPAPVFHFLDCTAGGINPQIEKIKFISQVENSSSLVTTRLCSSVQPFQSNASALVLSALPFSIQLLLTNKPRDKDGTYGTDRLNPRRGILQAGSSHDHLNCPAQSSYRQERPNDPNGSNRYSIRNFPLTHSTYLQRNTQPSLQAPCHHVQRGAA